MLSSFKVGVMNNTNHDTTVWTYRVSFCVKFAVLYICMQYRKEVKTE